MEGTFDFTQGYRVDDLTWNVAGPQYDPNILSELTWDNVESYQIKGSGELLLKRHIALKGSIDYGWIYDGKVQDSDFLGDDRTFEFSRATADANDGHVFDGSLGAGYLFRFGKGRFSLTPLVGYSHHEQNLVARNGFQEISPIPELTGPVGPIDALDSSYETKWKGPWIGLDLAAEPGDRFSFLVGLEYHWADYEAEADWNLREDFAHPVSFSDEADGGGVRVSCAVAYQFSKHFSVKAGFEFQSWSTDSGTQTVFGADGSSSDQPLNEVNWDSYSVFLGLVCEV